MSFADDIKTRVRIEDIVSKYVELNKNGGSLKGLCPFHEEKTASFHVNTDKQFYKCFGCQSAGDVIEFYQNYFRLDTGTAMKELAAIAGLTNSPIGQHISPVKPSKPLNANTNFVKSLSQIEEDIYYEAFGKYCEIYPENHAHRCAINDVQKLRIDMNSLIFEALYEYCAKKWNKKAYEYLTDIRKIPDIQIEKFKIFSVDNYFEVNNHLKKNFTLIELQRAGLFNLKEDRSGNFIFYAHRIIIPYQHNNKIVYLRGRYFDEGGSAKANENKYLGLRNDGVGVNTPKRFFNIDVLSTMFKGEKIFMTEGEFDAIIMDAMGRNAIAIPGVGNLPGLDQLKKLEQFDINICADNDQPGQALLEQLKKIFFGMGKNVTVKQLPSKDVNDFWVENISLQVK